MKQTMASGNRMYREMLQNKRRDVMAGLGVKFDTLAKMGRVGEEDQAQITHDESVSLSLNRLDYVQLRMIEAALDRLDAGDYGTCLGCDEQIPPKRLKALPWARYCVPCQESIGADTEDQDPRATSRLPVSLAD